MSDDAGENLLVERRNGVGWITLHQPAKANALTLSMQQKLVDFLTSATGDDNIAAVVITGAGSRAFSGGADFSEPLEGTPAHQAQRRSERLLATCLALIAFPKPLVAAVNGHAAGSGFILALLADARISTPEATFSLPEIQRGNPTFAGAALLSQMLGDVFAMDLVLTGRRMGATEARRLGLLGGIDAFADLQESAQGLADRLGKQPRGAYQANKTWIYRNYPALLTSAYEHSALRRDAAAMTRGQ